MNLFPDRRVVAGSTANTTAKMPGSSSTLDATVSVGDKNRLRQMAGLAETSLPLTVNAFAETRKAKRAAMNMTARE